MSVLLFPSGKSHQALLPCYDQAKVVVTTAPFSFFQRIPEPARAASVRGVPAQEPGITAGMGTAALLRGA